MIAWQARQYVRPVLPGRTAARLVSIWMLKPCSFLTLRTAVYLLQQSACPSHLLASSLDLIQRYNTVG
jgi:hypothetical protein